MQQCIKNKLEKACGIEINIIPLQNKIRNMIVIAGLVTLAIVVEKVWSPRLDWLDEESMLILYYNKKNTRDYLVIVKF
jgi:hypothetical protein